MSEFDKGCKMSDKTHQRLINEYGMQLKKALDYYLSGEMDLSQLYASAALDTVRTITGDNT